MATLSCSGWQKSPGLIRRTWTERSRLSRASEGRALVPWWPFPVSRAAAAVRRRGDGLVERRSPETRTGGLAETRTGVLADGHENHGRPEARPVSEAVSTGDGESDYHW